MESATLLKWLRYGAFAVPCLLVAIFLTGELRDFKVDDAFMFYRYALHFRSGLGISWNSDGLPTYGLTSLGWFFVVLLFSFLPWKPVVVLILASTLMLLIALFVMTRSLVSHSESSAMRSPALALSLIGLPLLLQPYFALEIVNGMETMLSLLANALIVSAALSVMRRPSARSAALLGLAGYIAFFVRPDNGLCAALIPLLLSLLWPSFRLKHWVVAEVCLLLPVGIQIFCAYKYFGTPLPLGFYLKSVTGYKGFICTINAGVELSRFLFICLPYICISALMARSRMQLKLLAIFGIPLLAICAYLLTVLQIMGNNARYYVPYLPFIILPSLLVLDRGIAESRVRPARIPVKKVAMACAICLGVIWVIDVCSKVWVEHANRKIALYTEPARVLATAQPLEGLTMVQQYRFVGDSILPALPRGTTLAASEVGYIGAQAPQVDIIDIVGLNNTQIALHGFSMHALLERAPDMIWMPPGGYTWLRHEMWSDPAFLSEYDIYDGVFAFGIAIRKASPRRAIIEHQIAATWARDYPHARMDNYRVLSIQSPQNRL